MLCYKDRTFCKFSDCKEFNNNCHRAFTKKVEKEYSLIISEQRLPVAYFLQKPGCFR